LRSALPEQKALGRRKPLMDLHVPAADGGFNPGSAKSAATPSKILVSAMVKRFAIWQLCPQRWPVRSAGHPK